MRPAYGPPPQGPFYSAPPEATSGSGLGFGIPGLLLSILGLLTVLTLQTLIYALSHNHLTYTPNYLTAEKALSWVGVATLGIATVLGAVGARKPKGGVAVAALVICGLSGAIFSVPVF